VLRELWWPLAEQLGLPTLQLLEVLWIADGLPANVFGAGALKSGVTEPEDAECAKRRLTMSAGNRWLLAVVVVPLFAVLEIAPAPAQDRTAEKEPLFKVEKDGLWRESLAFTPGRQRLACDLVLRDFTGKELAQGDVAGLPPCMYVAFSPDGKRLASIHFDDGQIQARHAICLWSVTADNKLSKVATLQPKKDQRTAHRRSMYFLTFSQDSSMLATREQDDSTTVWDATTGKERLRLDTQGLVVGFAPDARTLTTVTRDGLVQHWDLATKKSVAAPADAKREDYLFAVNAIASADGKTLALTDDISVILKGARSGKTLRRFDNRFMRNLTLSADGKTFAAITEDRWFCSTRTQERNWPS
jgi:hypothetical protein